MAVIKGFIFDMDGTMFDTECISVEAMQQVACQYGVKVEYRDALQFLGLPREEIQKRFLLMFGEDFDYTNYRLDKISYQDAVIKEKGVPIKPGLWELLQYAKEHEILCAVATSTSRERAMGLLSGAGVDGEFSVIVCGEDVRKGKPNPDIFLYTTSKLGLEPSECIVLEDSRNGILAAANSGSYAILIPDLILADEEMKKAADLVCKDLHEVLEYIKKENA